jgi:copper resistance protein D
VIDPLIGARAVHFAATAFVAGVMFFDAVIARPILVRGAHTYTKRYFATLDRFILTSVAFAILSGLVWSLLLAAKIGDETIGAALADGTFSTLLTETRFGYLWIARGALAAVVALTARAAGRRFGWIGLVSASLMLAALAWIGHAGARSGAVGWLHVSADMAHLLAAGAWLGSLPALALLLSRSGAGPRAIPAAAGAAVTRRFSVFGIAAVVTLLITGVINALLLTDSVASLADTDYGRLLLIKIGLFALMVALASINRWFWTPKLPNGRAIAMVRRHSLIETGLGALIIAIVGVLGTLPPPVHQHAHTNEALPEAAFVHIHDLKGMADVTVLPGRPGPTDVWLRLMREDFTPLAAETVAVRLSHPGQATVVGEARSDLLGLWRASGLVLPVAGVWMIVVEVRTNEGDPLILDAPLVLQP